jgi:hypothetical protein
MRCDLFAGAHVCRQKQEAHDVKGLQITDGHLPILYTQKKVGFKTQNINPLIQLAASTTYDIDPEQYEPTPAALLKPRR